MSEIAAWTMTLVALLSAGAFLVEALGIVQPDLALRKRIHVVFLLAAAAGGLRMAWVYGGVS